MNYFYAGVFPIAVFVAAVSVLISPEEQRASVVYIEFSAPELAYMPRKHVEPVDVPPAWTRGNAYAYQVACKTLDSAIEMALDIQAGRPLPVHPMLPCRPFLAPIKSLTRRRESWGYEVDGLRYSVWSVTDQAREIEFILLPDDIGPERRGA